jgi:hypothetical protein
MPTYLKITMDPMNPPPEEGILGTSSDGKLVWSGEDPSVLEGFETFPMTQEEIDAIVLEVSLKEIDTVFNSTITQPVDCIVDGVTYQMNCMEESCIRLKHGIELMELLGQGTLTVVGYNNVIYPDLPLTTCLEILKQQAQVYYTAYMTRINQKNALLNPEG